MYPLEQQNVGSSATSVSGITLLEPPRRKASALLKGAKSKVGLSWENITTGTSLGTP
jgi:hypothetical protein